MKNLKKYGSFLALTFILLFSVSAVIIVLAQDTTPPSTVTLSSPPHATTTTNMKPTFTWNPATDASGIASYTFQIDTSREFNSPRDLRTVSGITTTSYTPDIALSGRTWYWHVRALDNAGNLGAYSDIWAIFIVHQISGSETWTGNVQLNDTIHVVGSGSLTIDGATVKFDDRGAWYDFMVEDSARMIVQNGADLNGIVGNVWWRFPNGTWLKYELWIGAITCDDISTVTITDSKVGALYVYDSSTVTVTNSEIHCLHCRNEEYRNEFDNTIRAAHRASSIKPVIRNSIIRELYMTVKASTGPSQVTGTTLTGTLDLACDFDATVTIDHRYLFLYLTGTAEVKMDNLPNISSLGYWLECETKDTAKLNMTNAPNLDLSQEPIARQTYDVVKTRIKAFGSAQTVYLENVVRDYIYSTGEPVYVRNSWIAGVYYTNPDPLLWAKFGAGTNNFLSWFNPTPPSADTTPPTISISSPTSEQIFYTSAITVSGTASDNVEVSRVEVKVGSGLWQVASGTTAWNIQVTLSLGSNTIYAKAVDTSGNPTETSMTVTYNPQVLGGSILYLDDKLTVDKIWQEGDILHIIMTITVTECKQSPWETDYVCYFWTAFPQHGKFNGTTGIWPFPASMLTWKYKATNPTYKQCTVEWVGKIPGNPIFIGCLAVGNGFVHFGHAMIVLHENSYQETENSAPIPIEG